jgi:hypothetical protein
MFDGYPYSSLPSLLQALEATDLRARQRGWLQPLGATRSPETGTSQGMGGKVKYLKQLCVHIGEMTTCFVQTSTPILLVQE